MFARKVKGMEEKFIFWLDEIGTEHNHIVGKKCANLGEMTRANMPVPKGFVLSMDAYDAFLNRTGVFEKMEQYLKIFKADPNNMADMDKYLAVSNDLRRMMESEDMPEDMAAAVIDYYTTLCRSTGSSDTPVATRSAGPVSHPGQYETYLHVRGTSDLMEHIIKVWSSTFNHRSLVWRAREGLPLHSDPIGVAVLQMVNARSAGVLFTLNPLNGDRSKVVIEGNWGLGESVVSGITQTDKWTVDKVTREIVSRQPATKTAEHVVDPVTETVVVIESPPDRRDVLCLSDEEVLELSMIGKALEGHFGAPQDIEWAIASDLPFPDNVFVLQTRPETIWRQKADKPKLGKEAKALSFFSNKD